MEIQSISTLFERLGYKDPCPKKGRNNKIAMKLRRDEKAKYNIKQYQIGSRKVYEAGGYIKVPLYEYEGIQYSEDWG